MNEILKGLLKVTQDVAKLAVEVEVAKHTPVVVVQPEPRTLIDELFGTPQTYRAVDGYVYSRSGARVPRKCTINTPWQVCEDRNCFHHAGEDRRDMSKLR